MKVFSTSSFSRSKISGPEIGCCGARSVEIDLLAPEIIQGLDFRTDEDVQFGGKQVEDICDALADVRNQRLELVQRIGVDDRGVDALEVEQSLDVFSRAARDYGKHVQVVTIVHNARNFGREADRGAFQLSAGQPDSPGVEPLDCLQFGCAARYRCRGLIGRRAGVLGVRPAREAGAQQAKDHSKNDRRFQCGTLTQRCIIQRSRRTAYVEPGADGRFDGGPVLLS